MAGEQRYNSKFLFIHLSLEKWPDWRSEAKE